jgi:tRNA threonylcarbamoyladenosine biosynthesis protein TsaB
MRILALETSGMAGSLAVLENDRSLAEIELDSTRRTAQTLAPAVQQILQQVRWKPESVELVAVTSGPGSFTGLRIGVATAKTFAYATRAGAVGVNTLAVIARGIQAAAGGTPLWVVMNAEREQLFAASFLYEQSTWRESQATHIVDQQLWLSRVSPGCLVAGPGLKSLLARIPAGVVVVPESFWMPRAAEVGREGLQAYLAGRQSDCWSLLPNYFRESAAVEKAQHPSGPNNRLA